MNIKKRARMARFLDYNTSLVMQKYKKNLSRRAKQDPFALPGRRSYLFKALLMSKATMAGYIQWWQSYSVVGRSSVARVSKGIRVDSLKVINGSVILRDALRALSTNGSLKQKKNYRACILIIFLIFIYAKAGVAGTDLLSCVDKFKGLPYLDDMGIIVTSELLHIEEYPHAFNASFIELNDNYLIVFRQDTKKNAHSMPMTITMAQACADKEFKSFNKLHAYKTEQSGAHDGRLFSFNNELYLLFTYLLYKGDVKLQDDILVETQYMQQALARLDEYGDIMTVRELQYGEQKKEKNWTPFNYRDQSQIPHLYFFYKFNPKEIIHLHKSGYIEQVVKDQKKSESLVVLWERQWGEIRGGTPAIQIDDEYVTFFHSSFKHKKKTWYVCGALTFENQPPFAIKRISRCPILAHNFYTAISSDKRLFSPDALVLFPCGLQCKDNYLYVLCGENDIAMRLIILDTRLLMESLIKV